MHTYSLHLLFSSELTIMPSRAEPSNKTPTSSHEKPASELLFKLVKDTPKVLQDIVLGCFLEEEIKSLLKSVPHDGSPCPVFAQVRSCLNLTARLCSNPWKACLFLNGDREGGEREPEER